MAKINNEETLLGVEVPAIELKTVLDEFIGGVA